MSCSCVLGLILDGRPLLERFFPTLSMCGGIHFCSEGKIGLHFSPLINVILNSNWLKLGLSVFDIKLGFDAQKHSSVVNTKQI